MAPRILIHVAAQDEGRLNYSFYQVKHRDACDDILNFYSFSVFFLLIGESHQHLLSSLSTLDTASNNPILYTIATDTTFLILTPTKNLWSMSSNLSTSLLKHSFTRIIFLHLHRRFYTFVNMSAENLCSEHKESRIILCLRVR